MEFKYAEALKAPAEAESTDFTYANALKAQPASSTPNASTATSQTDAPAEGLWDKITGSQRETEETKGLPSFISAIGPSATSPEKARKGDLQSFPSISWGASSSMEEFLKDYAGNNEGTTWEKDNKGNTIVTLPDGRKSVLNPSGLDKTDIAFFGKEALKYLPASRVAGWGSQGGKLLARAGAQMLGAGVTSATSEALSEDFEPKEVAVETALAGGGELIPYVFRGAKNLKVAFTGLKKQDKKLADTIATMAESGVFKGAEEAVPKAAREAAVQVEGQKVKAMRDAAAPFYKRAYEDNPTVDFKSVQGAFREAKRPFGDKSPAQKVFKEWQDQLAASKNFEQLASTYRTIRDSVKYRKFGEVGGAEGQLIEQGGKIVKELRKALSEASPEFAKANRIYAGQAPAIESMKGQYIGRIARMTDDQLDTLAKDVFSKNKDTAKKALDLLDLQSPNMSRDLRAIEFKRRLESVSESLLEETPVEGIWKKLFKSDGMRSDALYQSMSAEERHIMSKMEMLTRKAAEARKNTKTRVLTGTSMTNRGDGVSIASLLVSPITVAKVSKARITSEQAQREIIALAETLTNPEVLKRPEIKKFLGLNLYKADELQEASRIIIQLSDEIASSLSEEQDPQTQETQ